jgi:hypothetical protein
MAPSCCTVRNVAATYLALLVMAFVLIAAFAAFTVAKLLAGRR